MCNDSIQEGFWICYEKLESNSEGVLSVKQ